MKYLLLALTLAFPAAASAHDLYDYECCYNEHCRPVSDDAVENLADGVLVQNFGLLAYSDRRLHWSRDGSNHICKNASGHLLCVYRRPVMD